LAVFAIDQEAFDQGIPEGRRTEVSSMGDGNYAKRTTRLQRLETFEQNLTVHPRPASQVSETKTPEISADRSAGRAWCPTRSLTRPTQESTMKKLALIALALTASAAFARGNNSPTPPSAPPAGTGCQRPGDQ